MIFIVQYKLSYIYTDWYFSPTRCTLRLAIDVRSGTPPSPSWKRPRGRPRDSWLKPFLHSNIPIKERWDAAVRRGHGVSAQRPSLGTRVFDDISPRIHLNHMITSQLYKLIHLKYQLYKILYVYMQYFMTDTFQLYDYIFQNNNKRWFSLMFT